MSSGGEFRIGSDAPEVPEEAGGCGAPWPAEWEDRAEARPACQRSRGHAGGHRAEVTGLDGRCRRYEWGEAGEPRVGPC